MRPVRRRSLLAAAAWAVAGCAADPAADAGPPAAPGQPQRLRTLQGGFLSPVAPARGPGLPGQLPRPALPLLPAGGPFVRWVAPVALALRGPELLVADAGSGRLWRADAWSPQMSAIAGAPVGRQTALALGVDLSAWVLDPFARQLLRFGRDARLLQTLRLERLAGAPVALALAEDGLTMLVADGSGAAWTELRGGAGFERTVAPELPGGARVQGVNALVAASGQRWLLDRSQGCVHRATPEGRVLASLGRGLLQQPTALGVDRLGRAYVLDGAAVLRLDAAGGHRRWSAAELGLQQPAALAVDGLTLALADALSGSVVLLGFEHEAPADGRREVPA